jgi:hypothetical protein
LRDGEDEEEDEPEDNLVDDSEPEDRDEDDPVDARVSRSKRRLDSRLAKLGSKEDSVEDDVEEEEEDTEVRTLSMIFKAKPEQLQKGIHSTFMAHLAKRKDVTMAHEVVNGIVSVRVSGRFALPTMYRYLADLPLQYDLKLVAQQENGMFVRDYLRYYWLPVSPATASVPAAPVSSSGASLSSSSFSSSATTPSTTSAPFATQAKLNTTTKATF